MAGGIAGLLGGLVAFLLQSEGFQFLPVCLFAGIVVGTLRGVLPLKPPQPGPCTRLAMTAVAGSMSGFLVAGAALYYWALSSL